VSDKSLRELLIAFKDTHLPCPVSGSEGIQIRFSDAHISFPLKGHGELLTIEDLDRRDDVSRVTQWSNVRFQNCEFVHIAGVTFTNCKFLNTTVTVPGTASFTDCNMISSEARTDNLIFNNCEVLVSVLTSGASIRIEANCTTFDSCKFQYQTLSKVGLTKCRIIGCAVQSDCWNKVDFDNVEIRDSFFSSSMKFQKLTLLKVVVDRVFIESLGESRGGLTDVDIRSMTVLDPIAELRLVFSGWMFYLHVLAMCLFFSSYVGFIVWKCLQAWMIPAGSIDAREYLICSLGKFILFGWVRDSGLLAVASSLVRGSTFLAFLIYNLARLVLLLKVRELEHRRNIVGIWPEFQMEGRATFLGWKLPESLTWRRLKTIVSYLTYVAIFCGLVHFVSLLTTPVPR
jgi:hypothetical protein